MIHHGHIEGKFGEFDDPYSLQHIIVLSLPITIYVANFANNKFVNTILHIAAVLL